MSSLQLPGRPLGGHNPDVLTCIANLSNDEVFTPPTLANAMLDLVAESWARANGGASIWANPDVTFLDPFAKSGVFLREITRRLTEGLEGTIPDLRERVDHILTKQVFGIAITELTALMTRRSVYCSKYANGVHSIARSFTTEDGNVWFERTEHTWNRDGKCTFCGASKSELDRGDARETHAYAFIHTNDINTHITDMFGANAPMHFDVIIGNPPYQLSDGGFGTSAAPIYQLFVEQAKRLDPHFLVMVTPSRWFAGGKGLNEFREEMLADHRIHAIVDYPKLYEVFSGTKIRGGVSYFLWDREYDGPCTIQTMWDGQPVGEPVARFLDAYDVLVRRNEAIPILEKVRALGEPTLDARVSSRKPFGLATNFKGKSNPAGMSEPIKLFANQRIDWIERTDLLSNITWADHWKVLMNAVQGTSAALETKFLSKPILAGPGTACTETYLVAGLFDTEERATRYAAFLRTRFVRFLVSLRKATQHATRDVYSFVPDVPLDRVWTDALLYERYGLNDDEIAFIESQVAPHDDTRTEITIDTDDSEWADE
ncbi:MAG: Eco57I restriction-modification methylase domain-containing protein [Thermomicrobiales bacterium]